MHQAGHEAAHGCFERVELFGVCTSASGRRGRRVRRRQDTPQQGESAAGSGQEVEAENGRLLGQGQGQGHVVRVACRRLRCIPTNTDLTEHDAANMVRI